MPVPLTAGVETTYAATIERLVTGIRDGLFPPRPPAEPDVMFVQCPYCNPDGVGHAEPRRRWDRVKHDPRLRELVSLIEPISDPTPPGGAA